MYANTRSVIVNDVMTYPVITASEKESIKRIAQKMNRHDIDSIVITNKTNEPVGIVTESDIIRRLLTRKRQLFFSKAKHVMSRPVVAISKHIKLEDAAKIMASKKVGKLCVIDEDNKLLGIITEEDIVKHSSYLIDILKEIINTGYVKETALY